MRLSGKLILSTGEISSGTSHAQDYILCLNEDEPDRSAAGREYRDKLIFSQCSLELDSAKIRKFLEYFIVQINSLPVHVDDTRQCCYTWKDEELHVKWVWPDLNRLEEHGGT